MYNYVDLFVGWATKTRYIFHAYNAVEIVVHSILRTKQVGKKKRTSIPGIEPGAAEVRY